MSTIEITIGNTKVTLPANLDTTFEVNGVKVSVNTTPTALPNVPKTNTNGMLDYLHSQEDRADAVARGMWAHFTYRKPNGECSTRRLFVSVATDTHIAGVEDDGSYKNFRRERITHYLCVTPD